MAISTEGKLGLLVGLIGLGGAGAVVIAPVIGWVLMGIAAIGGVALAYHQFSARLARLWEPSARFRMIALVSMVVTGIGFLGSAAVYFWPTAPIPHRRRAAPSYSPR